MFATLFGWSKASKCKNAINVAKSRLRILKNKRQAAARRMREELAELIQSGHEEAAVNQVEKLIQDESLAAAYELMDNFCEFILTRLSYIRRHKDCPNDINEAVSSLIFASARCSGDVPELSSIRELFRKRYGDKFATTALKLFPGNLVNKQLKENLSSKSVPDDVKYRVVDAIARDHCLHRQQPILAIEYHPNWQEMKVKENKGYQLVVSDAQINNTIAGSEVHPSEIEDVKCVNNSSYSKPSDSYYLPQSSFADDASAIVCTVQKYPPYTLSSPLQKKVGELEIMDYVDDIEECQLSVAKDGTCYDQTLFKFRSCGLPRIEKDDFGYDGCDIDQSEKYSSMRISRRRPEKRSRRRSTSMEKQGIMDIGYMMYYQKPSRSPSSPRRKKHRKPCYSCLYDDDDKNCAGAQSVKPKRETRATTHGMELVIIPQRPNRKSFSGGGNNEMEAVISASHKVSNPRVEAEAPYSRAMTMSQERGKDKMLRTYLCPSQRPNHVHHKLPDYDDIAAKFTALKSRESTWKTKTQIPTRF